MIVIISSQGKTLESQPNPRFGRSKIYIKYNLQDETWEALENPAITQAHGAGVAASQFLVDHKVDVAISGDFGPNAYRALNTAGIKMFTFSNNYQSIQEVIEAFQNNALEQA